MNDVSCVQVGSELKTLQKLLCTEYETIRFDKRQNTLLRTDLYIYFLSFLFLFHIFSISFTLFSVHFLFLFFHTIAHIHAHSTRIDSTVDSLPFHWRFILVLALDVLSFRYRFADDRMIYLNVACFSCTKPIENFLFSCFAFLLFVWAANHGKSVSCEHFVFFFFPFYFIVIINEWLCSYQFLFLFSILFPSFLHISSSDFAKKVKKKKQEWWTTVDVLFDDVACLVYV